LPYGAQYLTLGWTPQRVADALASASAGGAGGAPSLTPDAPRSQLGREGSFPEKRGSRGPRSRVPGCPTRDTGAPDKDYRPSAAPQFPRSAQTSRKRGPLSPSGPRLRPTGVPDKRYRGPRQEIPGRPTKTTGVPDKRYRGAQQEIPGRPTKTTGVPDKPPSQKVLQKGEFLRRNLASLCYCLSCSVMLLNNNYRENGEVYPWGQIASN
jgi:hypothetical protein